MLSPSKQKWVASIICVVCVTFMLIAVTYTKCERTTESYDEKYLGLATAIIAWIDKDDDISFASASPFFERMQASDLIARHSPHAQKYKDTYISSLQLFTQAQKNILERTITEAKDQNLRETRLLQYIPWKLAKIDEVIEVGYPHTLGDVIVLSDTMFPRYAMHNYDQYLKQTMIHEQIHVFQRKYPEFATHFVTSVLGFTEVQQPLHRTLQSVLQFARNNPDVNGMYALEGQLLPLQVYNSPSPTDIADSRLVLYNTVANRFATKSEEMFFNECIPDYITQKEHPYEIMAVLLSKVLMNDGVSYNDDLWKRATKWVTQYL